MGGCSRRMRKLRLSILLPTIQLPLAVTLWEWGARIRTSTVGPDHFRSGPLLSYGINAPAVFLRLAAFPFTRTDSSASHLSLFGYGLEELSFFLGVVILWVLVGKYFDLRMSNTTLHNRQSTRRALSIDLIAALIVAVMAIALFVEGVEGLRIPFRWGSYWGTIEESVLFLVWSVALLFFSYVTLAGLAKRSTKAKLRATH